MSSRPSRGAARLAAILDALPDALVLVNANGTVVNANSIALEAFEAPGTALVGRGLLDLLPQFDSRLIPGSMRRPDHVDPRARTKPTRMVARRTDGSEFPVEVASANLENGQQAYDGSGYTGDELLMLVVRDLSGTVDTEAELARSQRQTEMILRAASEGVVGTDTDGRIVLVNPAAAQILGYRASDLGGRELHTLVLHSRADGSPFPYAESPLADTLRSGRKHRVRGQVLFSKSGDQLPVDLTTAPVRDGDQLVGAVMTFTDRRPHDELVKEHEEAERRHAGELERLAEEHASELTALRLQHLSEIEGLEEAHAEELAAHEDRYAALGEREKDRYEALAARHDQLLTLLATSLRGPLEELRHELAALAADDAGQLWPEANQVLHHLTAGYSRITTLIDNVLGYQRLDTGAETIARTKVMLDAVVAAGVEGAVELIGPGRVQFAVHAPPIEAEADPLRLATALAHLIADVAGVDATGNTQGSAGGYLDNTVVVAAAQRGEVVRIEVRGPHAGGDPVHEPIVRGIVRAHGGVLQTHEVPGMSGSAYVLEVPIGGGAGTVAPIAAPAAAAIESGPATAPEAAGAAVAVVPGAVPGATPGVIPGATPGAVPGAAPGVISGVAPDAAPVGSGAAGASVAEGAAGAEGAVPGVADVPEGDTGQVPAGGGRRRARRSSVDAFLESEVGGASGEGEAPAAGPGTEGAVPTGRRRRRAAGQETAPVPAQAAPAEGSGGTGRRRGRPAEDTGASGVPALPAVAGVSEGAVVTAAEHAAGAAASNTGLGGTVPPQGVPAPAQGVPAGTGQRARQADGAQQALPPALPAQAGEPVPAEGAQPTGRRRRALASANERAAAQEAAPRQVFALPPAEADRPAEAPAEPGAGTDGSVAPGDAVGAPGAVAPGAGGTAGPAAAVTGPAGAVGAPLPPVPGPAGQVPVPVPGQGPVPGQAPAPLPAGQTGRVPMPGAAAPGGQAGPVGPVPPTGQAPVPAGGLPLPAPAPAPAVPGATPGHDGQHDVVPHDQDDDHTPPQPHPTEAPTGRRRRAVAAPPADPAPVAAAPAAPAQSVPAPDAPVAPAGAQPGPAAAPRPAGPPPAAPPAPAAQAVPAPQPWPATADTPDAGTPVPPQDATGPAPRPASAAPAPAAPAPALTPSRGTPLPPENTTRAAQPLPAEAAAPADAQATQGRAISVRTLGQGVPFNRQAVQVQQPSATPAPQQPGGSGRRRKLGTPPDPAAGRPEQAARPQRPGTTQPQPQVQAPAQGPETPPPPSLGGPQGRPVPAGEGPGRSYAIGAPDENAAEGPEPLDGPGGAVEVADPPRPQPLDDELPPEPLDNPRRLLVWPAPDVSTQQALSDRGYRPVIVHSREEVDAQIAAFPAALFVDPLTGPITRTALQSLRQAAVAAEVPVLVTAGLGQSSRDAAYGADPAVLLKALAPRDSEQHPPRVLLIEEHAEIALALTATLERRGMQVARAADDADAVALAGHFRPNLVVMDLMQVHRRQAGIVDWLRANGQLNRTPLVVYTAAMGPADLPRLASGETVLFLAERSTSGEVQTRIVDLLSRIGTN
ncbi:PAS domain-containing protein [Streptomyces sp. AD55]|uniref:PAS domain-containing protein n=1 Tax=Streptomyces sp. AD55 TaxID=3242895 RepID=UPI0035275714